MMGTVSPRYMNHIPGEVLKAGCRSEGAKVAGSFYWNFRISLKTSRKVVFFDSKSHKLQVLSQNDSKTSSELIMTNECLPIKDFIFTYTTEDF